MNKSLVFLAKVLIAFMVDSVVISLSTVIIGKILQIIFDESLVSGLSFMYFLFALATSFFLIYNHLKDDKTIN